MDHIAEMREAHFDVCEDGVLVCLDRTIGSYESAKYDLVVRLSPSRRLLELRTRGRLAATFDLDQGVRKACMDASAAYFFALAERCRQTSRPALQLVS